ncbi:MAG: AI-2E family transporter [Candidatus Peribacteria bacterium]|nr:MAG: AI-2E family transporter [Candidatus Peribacteria bacterium]
MTQFKKIFAVILTKGFFKKVIAYGLLILMFYLFQDFLGIFLLTFIFSYLFFSTGRFLKEKLDSFVEKNAGRHKKLRYMSSVFRLNVIVFLEYVLFIGLIIFVVSDMLPKLTRELSELPNYVPLLSDHLSIVTQKLQEIRNFNTELGGTINQVFTTQDYEVIVQIFDRLRSASVIFLQIVLSLVLSFIFIIDRNKMKRYLLRIKESNFSFLYDEYRVILQKIVNSFGLILKAQAMIAAVNTVLTVIGLIVIGLIHGTSFPYILTLGLLVFILGFVPVIGVFLSSIPIIIVAFTFIGGPQVVLEIITLIIIVHAVEAYYLNPKIVSSFLELPVSLTFVILIVSEHFFGFAGLLIGVSLFYFSVGLLADINEVIQKKRNKILAIRTKT